uniref:non-specific serine/threonine protein kinase n=1 Tax=Leersia perrieri TaxID=77586 RepID=A0A0D9VRU6_9ORYZ
MRFASCVAICLALAAVLLLPSHATATSSTGTIQRETKQQILATIPPHWQENPVLFLTSPSGKYTAYFLRSQTAPGAGGLGADFCYVEVLDTSEPGAEGRSVWESECLAVSTVNTCSLVFSWKGLEVFDGSNSVWHTHDTQSDSQNFLETLELVDEGDMRILDKGGELAWKASDEPRAAQHCGLPGSPGLASAFPPFAEPIGHGSSDLPFGFGHDGGHVGGNGVGVGAGGAVAQPELPIAPVPQEGDLGGAAGVVGPQGQGAVDGAGQTSFGFGAQPLVDNSPYDSGAWKQLGGCSLAAIGVGLLLNVAIAMGLGH